MSLQQVCDAFLSQRNGRSSRLSTLIATTPTIASTFRAASIDTSQSHSPYPINLSPRPNKLSCSTSKETSMSQLAPDMFPLLHLSPSAPASHASVPRKPITSQTHDIPSRIDGKTQCFNHVNGPFTLASAVVPHLLAPRNIL